MDWILSRELNSQKKIIECPSLVYYKTLTIDFHFLKGFYQISLQKYHN